MTTTERVNLVNTCARNSDEEGENLNESDCWSDIERKMIDFLPRQVWLNRDEIDMFDEQLQTRDKDDGANEHVSIGRWMKERERGEEKSPSGRTFEFKASDK